MLRRLLPSCLVLLSIAAPATAAGRAPAGTAPCPVDLVPAYSGVDGAIWGAAAAAPSRVGTLIADFGNGPGTARIDHLAAAVARARAAGLRVVGYDDTRFARRPLSDALRDADRWEASYGVDGIFVDNLSGKEPDIPYYTALSRHVRALRGRALVVNGASGFTRDYMPLADIFIAYEGTLARYASHPMPGWTHDYPPARFASIVADAPGVAGMRRALDLAQRFGVGNVYVTDAHFPSPYFMTPSFFQAERTYLASRSGCAVARSRTRSGHRRQ